MQRVTVKHTTVFEKNVDAYESKKYRAITNQGSTRSSKTYSICQMLSLYVPYKYKKSISIVSPSLPHLKRGARRDFLNILNGARVYSDAFFNKTDQIYQYPKTGSYVEFFGAENNEKVRGPGRDILYINEANLIDYQTYKQLALRTTETIFLDFNPADEHSWVYDVADSPDNILIHSTYKDNLAFLGKAQIKEIEDMQYADQNLWKVYGLGLRGSSEGTIYTHWKQCGGLPGKGEVFYGQDFGYNVASALVKVELYEGAIYVEEMLYETKLTTNDLIERYKTLGIGKRDEIYCDAAEPKTIEELVRAKYNAISADKDVTEGIKKVKSMPLYVTADSVNLIKELKSYKWKDKKDKTEKKQDNSEKDADEPVKFMDHACDALRYAVFTKLKQQKKQWLFA